MTCHELCFVGDKCSAVCDTPECIGNRVGGIKTLCVEESMNLDRDDIFTADIIEDGIQEYLEARAEERAEKEAHHARITSYQWSER